ncbi:SulP family inorganic anion transporter [Devosia sp. CN2-171]|uniref:SulP family inorganic anion transporter n=1 Tax=Devosia sp. CN2-171 TaxID=3400909 RepID=UPI003BF775A8
MSVALALSNGALLARGDLLPLLTPLAGAMLVATAVLPIATAWFSTIPGQVTTTQEIAVVALAAVTGAATAAFSGGEGLLVTILVTIGVTTTLCGVAMLALGWFRLGRITRFVPFPVFAGFLAITGWYLITGGLETIIGGHLSLGRLGEFLDPGTALKVGAGIAFVAAVEVAHRRLTSGAALPLGVLVAIVAFNLVIFALGIQRPALEEAGWLIAVPATGMSWPPVGFADFAGVDWNAVWRGLLFAPFVIVITAAGAMMNVSGIELDARRDVDLNAELRSIGLGNLASGIVGGIPGFPAVSTTMLALRLKTPYRAVGALTGLFAICALLFAPQVLGIVPLPLLGALLIWVGVSLTIDWLLRPMRTLRRSEYAIILIILAVSIGVGLPAGIATGLIAALILFAVEYARVDGIRFVASGRDFHSRAVSDERRSQLAERGDAIAIIKLGSFMFFGTSDRIVQRIARKAETGTGPWYAILDFSRVTGFDSSTVLSFERLRRMAERDKFQVVFAGLGELSRRLVDGGLDISTAPFHSEPDLEAGLTWAESQVLGAAPAVPQDVVSAEASLARLLGDADLADAIFPYLQRIPYEAGERLIQQGAVADDIYIVETGRGSVILENERGESVNLLDFGPGTILGEVAFYGIERRSASALATAPGAAWKLSRAALSQVETDKPLAAAAFHRALARVLAERLQSANRLIRVLAD